MKKDKLFHITDDKECAFITATACPEQNMVHIGSYVDYPSEGEFTPATVRRIAANLVKLADFVDNRKLNKKKRR